MSHPSTPLRIQVMKEKKIFLANIQNIINAINIFVRRHPKESSVWFTRF